MVSKEDLIRIVSEKTGERKEVVDEIVNGLLDTIVEELANGEEVKIVRFGKFNAKARVERNIINPSTKEMMRLPSLVNVSFKASQNVKDLLNK